LAEKEQLDLTPQQVKQAEIQKEAADRTVTARLPETYQWLLAPMQGKPSDAITWQALRLAGQDPLAVRASKKLRNDELLITSFHSSRLRMELERIPLWRGDHVSIAQLLSDFAQYIYLPRLRDPGVLLEAIESGIGLLTWMQDAYAYAESYDEAEARYRGLRAGQHIVVREGDKGLLVRPEVAKRQMDAEAAAAARMVQPGGPTGGGAGGPRPEPGNGGTGPGPRLPDGATPPPAKARPRRYHGSVELDPQRAGRDAGKIAEEVLTHLVGLPGATVRVTLEIEVDIPGGAPDGVVRTVTENGRTLKFRDNGFESE
jgi:hypothetical protein